MFNIFATVSDHLSQLFAQTWPPNWVLGPACAFNNSVMPTVNPVHDFQSYRWRNNEMRAFEEMSLPLENLASWTPVWTERAWNLLDRVWSALFGMPKELSVGWSLLLRGGNFSKRLSEADSRSRMFSTQSSISSSCLTRDVDLEGERDNASVWVPYQGTWEIVKSSRKRRFRNRWILGGISSRFFAPRSGKRGLWSVSMCNVLPIK